MNGPLIESEVGWSSCKLEMEKQGIVGGLGLVTCNLQGSPGFGLLVVKDNSMA